MILYPRPKTGVTSKLRTRSSEITYGLPAVLIGRSNAKDAMQTAAAIFFKLVMMDDILLLPFLQSLSFSFTQIVHRFFMTPEDPNNLFADGKAFKFFSIQHGDLLYLVKSNIFPTKIETEIERENNFKNCSFL